jgi:hypothetical protein
MKDKFSKSNILDVLGTLDTDENGKYIVIVEDKDDRETYRLDEDILKDMIGEKISIKIIKEELVHE